MKCPKCEHEFDPRVDTLALKKELDALVEAFEKHWNCTGPGPSSPPKIKQHEWTPRCASGECGKCRGSE